VGYVCANFRISTGFSFCHYTGDTHWWHFGLFLAFFGLFMAFFANFATIKKTFYKNLSVPIILILDNTLVLNLTFLGILSREISFGEKNSHPPTHPHFSDLH